MFELLFLDIFYQTLSYKLFCIGRVVLYKDRCNNVLEVSSELQSFATKAVAFNISFVLFMYKNIHMQNIFGYKLFHTQISDSHDIAAKDLKYSLLTLYECTLGICQLGYMSIFMKMVKYSLFQNFFKIYFM